MPRSGRWSSTRRARLDRKVRENSARHRGTRRDAPRCDGIEGVGRGRNCIAMQRVQASGQRLVELRKEVAVAIEGDRDRRVAEPLLDGLRMCAERDAEGGAGVAEVVE